HGNRGIAAAAGGGRHAPDLVAGRDAAGDRHPGRGCARRAMAVRCPVVGRLDRPAAGATARAPLTTQGPTGTAACAPELMMITFLALVELAEVPLPNRAVLPTPLPRSIVTSPATCALTTSSPSLAKSPNARKPA